MISDAQKASLFYDLLSKIKNQNHRIALLLQMSDCSMLDIKEIMLVESLDAIKTFTFRARQDLRNIIQKEDT